MNTTIIEKLHLLGDRINMISMTDHMVDEEIIDNKVASMMRDTMLDQMTDALNEVMAMVEGAPPPAGDMRNMIGEVSRDLGGDAGDRIVTGTPEHANIVVGLRNCPEHGIEACTVRVRGRAPVSFSRLSSSESESEFENRILSSFSDPEMKRHVMSMLADAHEERARRGMNR